MKKQMSVTSNMLTLEAMIEYLHVFLNKSGEEITSKEKKADGFLCVNGK